MSKEGKRSADPEILKALLIGATHEAAAAKAGVCARTVRRRLRDPAFVRKLRRLRTEQHQRQADQLDAINGQALRALAQLLQENHSDQIRLGALRTALGLSLKHREAADQSVRLTELEQRFAEQKGKSK
jgi:hypothetical protein